MASMPSVRLRVMPALIPIDGKNVELQATDDHIQWRNVGDAAWQNLLPLSEITGPIGPQGPAGQDGSGVPAGGTTGQVLVKISNADGNVGWTAAGAGDVLAANNANDFASKPDVRKNLSVTVQVADRTALKTLDTTKDTAAALREVNRDGDFVWTAGDFSAQIAADPQEGVFIKANAIAATLGAWVRRGSWALTGVLAAWFGFSATASAASNVTAYAAAKTLATSGYVARRVTIGGSTAPYPLTAGTNLADASNFELACVGAPMISIVGSGVGLKLSRNGTSGQVIQEFRQTGILRVIGNPTVTDCVEMRGLAQGCFIEHISARECTGKAFAIYHGVAAIFNTLICSNGWDGAFTTAPAYGVWFGENGTGYYTADCLLINPVMEGFAGTGIHFEKANGCKVVGGTPEGVGKGIYVSPSCSGISFDTVWMEANTNNDIEDYGKGSTYKNCKSQSVTSGNTVELGGYGTKFEGGVYRTFNFQSAGSGWDFDGCMVSDHPSMGFKGPGIGLHTRRNCLKVGDDLSVTGRWNDILPSQAQRTPSSANTTFFEVQNATGTSLIKLRADAAIAQIPAIYSLVDASPANVFVDSSGNLYRSTSGLKYKDVVGPIEQWMLDAYKEISGFLYRQKGREDGRLFVGMAADHFHDARLTMLVGYGDDGEVEGLHYERCIAFEREINRQQEARLTSLEETVAALVAKLG